jgi:phage gpG-like protein
VITVKILGAEQAQRALARGRADLMKLDLNMLAKEGMRLAAAFAPRRTGRLAASIRATSSPNRASISAGSTAVPYAAAINYGWRARHIPPAAFMQRADRVLRAEAPKRLDQIAARTLTRNHLT